MHKLVSSLIVLGAVTAADARPKPKKGDVAVHMERAAKAHKEGQFDVALQELQAAYALDAQPKLLFAMAQVYAKLDNCDAAIDHYEQFLAAETDKSKQSVVKQAIDACKKRLGEKAAAVAEPAAPPAVEPPAIEPKPGAAPPSPIETPPPRQQEPAPPPALTTTTTADAPWYTDVVGDVLVIAGIGATVGSVVFFQRAQGTLDAAEAAPNLETYRQHRDSAESKQVVAIALAGGGIALVAAGVLRFVLRDSTHETRSVALVPIDGGGVVTFGGGF